MSIPVELPSLSEVLAGYRYAYLMTTNGKDAPHAVAVGARLEAGLLVVDDIGRRTRENALARPTVGLVWPPADEAGYSLIVDGQATVAGGSLHIAPTRAVLHRPATLAEPRPTGACGADCVELDPRR